MAENWLYYISFFIFASLNLQPRKHLHLIFGFVSVTSQIVPCSPKPIGQVWQTVKNIWGVREHPAKLWREAQHIFWTYTQLKRAHKVGMPRVEEAPKTFRALNPYSHMPIRWHPFFRVELLNNQKSQDFFFTRLYTDFFTQQRQFRLCSTVDEKGLG